MNERERDSDRDGLAFVEVAPLYDTLMEGVPYDEWVAYLKRLLETHRTFPRKVLDLACGTGNVTELLAEEGFQVVGVDLAPGMIAEARRKAQTNGSPIEYHIQDAATLDLNGNRFDLCVSFFDSLNYITEPTRLQRAFHRVALHLNPGALFIFDLNSEFALKNRFFDQDNLGTDAPLTYDWDSVYFPQTRLCKVEMRFWHRSETGEERAFYEEHWQYAYREEEVRAMLTEAGLEPLMVYQAYTLRAPNRTADRLFYVARK